LGPDGALAWADRPVIAAGLGPEAARALRRGRRVGDRRSVRHGRALARVRRIEPVVSIVAVVAELDRDALRFAARRAMTVLVDVTGAVDADAFAALDLRAVGRVRRDDRAVRRGLATAARAAGAGVAAAAPI